VPCHHRRAALVRAQIRAGRSGRENYPLQPQLQPLGQLHDEPCPHEQPRIKNHPFCRSGIPLMLRFNCNMAGEDRPVIAPVTLI
jgi:hypothetical protein